VILAIFCKFKTAPKGEVIAVNFEKPNFTQVEVTVVNFVTPK
jgi:hypothetical protein